MSQESRKNKGTSAKAGCLPRHRTDSAGSCQAPAKPAGGSASQLQARGQLKHPFGTLDCSKEGQHATSSAAQHRQQQC